MATNPVPALDTADKTLLKSVAHRVVHHGLARRRPLPLRVQEYPRRLQVVATSFVTLKIDGDLRGCVGSLEARHPLITDVANNAYGAAFQDPRFAPLAEYEYPRVAISISVLSAAETVPCTCEAELIDALRPGVDGLIVEAGPRHRATFLPAVWQSIDQPAEFVRMLKIKAGLPPDYWSQSLRVSRYTTELIT